MEPLYIASRIIKCYSHLGNQFGISSKWTELPYDIEFHCQLYKQENWIHVVLHKNIHLNICGGIINNSQKVEIAQMSNNW